MPIYKVCGIIHMMDAKSLGAVVLGRVSSLGRMCDLKEWQQSTLRL